jgi:hypothetical protein
MPTPAYYTTPDGFVLRTSDGAMIPVDETNQDYIVFAHWVAAGNTAPLYPAQGE